MYDFEKLTQATSVEHAIALLMEDENARVICGGSDVLIRIREGKLAGCSLVSIHGIKALEGVSMEKGGTIAIGPATTFAGVTESAIVQQWIPALGYATDQAGGPQLRNSGTIGGNIVNGVTSADSAPALLTLNAELVIQGPDGTRTTALKDFYAGPGRVHLGRGELLTRIRIARRDYEGFSGHYIKYAMREAMDIATLGCAVQVKLEGGVIEDIRLAYGVAAPIPIRCPMAEAAVIGRAPDEETGRLLGERALHEVTPRTSWRASREFRLQLVRELAARALKQAIINKGGDGA
ncbi:xanthine dehydrogenase subunit XdhB [Bacillota bacterium Meth-B3]|nr:xanthine dehydrogenase subunit XdhB [Christensenellaceae bacterium]MEA5065532.1 xanthine dehydrogenase subunit XdhB [Eubacteriales bacterium]